MRACLHTHTHTYLVAQTDDNNSDILLVNTMCLDPFPEFNKYNLSFALYFHSVCF